MLSCIAASLSMIILTKFEKLTIKICLILRFVISYSISWKSIQILSWYKLRLYFGSYLWHAKFKSRRFFLNHCFLLFHFIMISHGTFLKRAYQIITQVIFFFKLVEFLCDGDEKVVLATIQNWFIQVHVTT